MTDLLPMFGEADLPSILFSLKPIYLDRILRGEKRYEYRRKFFRDASVAYVFVNAPVSAVRASITFGNPIVAPVKDIAAIAQREREGGGKSIREYMAGLSEGFAIPITRVTEIEPLPLVEIKTLYPRFQPPQSYMILRHDSIILRALRKRKTLKTINFPPSGK